MQQAVPLEARVEEPQIAALAGALGGSDLSGGDAVATFYRVHSERVVCPAY